MDHRDPSYLPEGWVKSLRNKRVVFLTPKPSRIVIQSRSMLSDYQNKGQFCDVQGGRLDFRSTMLSTSDTSSSTLPMEAVEVGDEDMEVDLESTVLQPTYSVRKTAAELQKELVENGTSRLQVDPKNPLNHAHELEIASDILRQALEDSQKMAINIDVNSLKELVMSGSDEEIIEGLKSSKELEEYFSQVSNVRCLAEMINLPHSESSPLVAWPPNVKQNVYCEILKLAKEEAKEVLSFLCQIMLSKDKPLGPEDVIRVADIFSTLAHTVSRNQNGLAKLKSVQLQTEGLSTAGLDRLARLKGTETSTSLSRGRHLLVELGQATFLSRVKQGQPFTLFCDNLNLRQQNMTQSVIHMDLTDTSMLSSVQMDPQLLPNLFKTENFLLGSPKNTDLLKHYEYAAAVRVGRIIGELVSEASKLRKLLPHSHKHERSKEVKVQSEIFIPPPDYLNEADNAEFFEFCMRKQSEFLDAVAESVKDKDAFLVDLELIKCNKVIETGILETEEELSERGAAERRVHQEVERFGRWIGYGDALTFKAFHLGVKALARGNCTAYERLEFLGHFRLALFHAKMNKIYMDFPVMMPRRAMMEDEGSLAELVAIAGIQGISTEDKKIGNAFEKHDQLISCVGHLYLANMYKNHVKDNPAALVKVADEASAVEFVLKMLEAYDIHLYFDPSREQPPEGKWDDPANYARDAIVRMIFSEMFDAGEEEEDFYLLRGLRLNMLVYFLNRKYKIQDSKVRVKCFFLHSI